jgi:DNA transformation protein
MNSTEFIEYIKDILLSEEVTFRRMFGGHGVYKAQNMLGLIAENELYFKANKEVAKYFEEQGSTKFTYMRKGKSISLSYWKVLPEVAEDQVLLKKWLDLASTSLIRNKSPAVNKVMADHPKNLL